MAQRKSIKWQVIEAVQSSELHAFGRLLVFVFTDLADAETGVIPEQRTPSIQELCKRSGMSKSSVVRYKDELVSLGWVLYRPPSWDQMAAHGSGRYAIRVGRNPDPKPVSQGETPEAKPKRGRKTGPVSQGDTPPASGPDSSAKEVDQDSMSQRDTPPVSQTETPAVSHPDTPEAAPLSRPDTPQVSDRHTGGVTQTPPVFQSDTPIKETTPTHTTPMVAADAAHQGDADGPKTTARKRSGGTRKKAAAKEPGPFDAVAHEVTVAFFEHAKDRNVQTFVAVLGVAKTALERGVPRDALARAMVGVLNSGYAISGSTLTVELDRMRKAAADFSGPGKTTGQQRLAAAAAIADDMRRLDEAEANAEAPYQPPILIALPPGRTA